MKGPEQLLVYEFAPGSAFRGELGGALERTESGGAMRIVEAMFVQRDADTGEVAVVDLRGDGAGGLIGPLLDFRLDPDSRRRATERALEHGTPGTSGEELRQLGESLEPGAAIAGLLVEHVWAAALGDAVAQTGGRQLISGFLSTDPRGQLGPLLLAAARRAHPAEAQ